MSETRVDAPFEGAGQAAGTEIWRIENFKPVPLKKSDYGTFYDGDSYVVLRSTETDSGALKYDLHFWLGKYTSEDEQGVAAMKTMDLDLMLHDQAVQHREVQGHESDLFLSYFEPCIFPKAGGVASGCKKVESEKFVEKLFVVKGSRVAVRVTEVKVSRDSLNHDDVFILDTQAKIFQFIGSNADIVEVGMAMQVVPRVNVSNHHDSAEVKFIKDEDEEGENGEFWGFLGGFGPLGGNTYEQSVVNVIKEPKDLSDVFDKSVNAWKVLEYN